MMNGELIIGTNLVVGLSIIEFFGKENEPVLCIYLEVV